MRSDELAHGSGEWVGGGLSAGDAALTGAHRERRLTRPRRCPVFHVEELVVQRRVAGLGQRHDLGRFTVAGHRRRRGLGVIVAAVAGRRVLFVVDRVRAYPLLLLGSHLAHDRRRLRVCAVHRSY